MATSPHEVDPGQRRASGTLTVRKRQQQRRRSGLLATLGGLLAGLAAAAAYPLQHHFAARFRIPSAPIADVDLVSELTRVAVPSVGTAPGTFVPERVRVEQPETGRLVLLLASTYRQRTIEYARQVGRAFEDRVLNMAGELRSTPTVGERLLVESAERTARQAAEADLVAEKAAAGLPQADPRVNREALMARWNALRTDWSGTRQTLEQTLAEAKRLQSQPEVSAGMVTSDERRLAIEEDVILQQDLSELTVRLSELRLHLLTVWQKSTGRLEQLQQAVEALEQTISQTDRSKLPANLSAAVAKMAEETAGFRDLLGSFAPSWTAEFTALQQSEVDPNSGEVLDMNERVGKLLHDFLFASGQRLSAARAQLNAIGEDPASNARHHVMHSNLTRAFQTLQSTRHRFEFAAGGLDTPENFKLDAALRSARGLRRRTQQRIEYIEKRLLSGAADRARRQQREALTAAEQAIAQIRDNSTQTVEEIFAVQEGLLTAARSSEEFVAGMLRAELAAQRVQAIRQDLAAIESRIAELSAQRAAWADALKVELLSCEVTGYDFQPWRRGQVGLAAMAASFLLILMMRRR